MWELRLDGLDRDGPKTIDVDFAVISNSSTAVEAIGSQRVTGVGVGAEICRSIIATDNITLV